MDARDRQTDFPNDIHIHTSDLLTSPTTYTYTYTYIPTPKNTGRDDGAPVPRGGHDPAVHLQRLPRL